MSEFLDQNKISENAKSVLKATRKLLETEGSGIIHDIYAETIRENREQAYIKRYKLTESKIQRRCLCHFLGKRCPWMYGKPMGDCITFEGIDHFSLWNRNGKPFVYISQPYGIGMDEMESLLAVCKQYNLKVNIDAYSWWYPDRTIFIEIHKEGWWQKLEQEAKS